jgi:hypothetical protein
MYVRRRVKRPNAMLVFSIVVFLYGDTPKHN